MQRRNFEIELLRRTFETFKKEWTSVEELSFNFVSVVLKIIAEHLNWRIVFFPSDSMNVIMSSPPYTLAHSDFIHFFQKSTGSPITIQELGNMCRTDITLGEWLLLECSNGVSLSNSLKQPEKD
ncbi:MAG: hypothetical protein LBU65_17095 [Planctomycetaceae bacterium]|jgi:hypothetical protein|nr:hypothetical protein [Planctomycetaceae bacterium]